MPTTWCRGKEHLYQSPRKQYHGSKAKLKKSWQHQLITTPLAANVLRFWLVSAARTRAAGASGWLFKAVGSLDKLSKMSWCHVTMLSSELASEDKKETSASYCRERIFAQARGALMSLLFEMDVMHDCSDKTVKSCHGLFARKPMVLFLLRNNGRNPAESYIYNSNLTDSTLCPAACISSLSPCFGADVPLRFRMFQTIWQLWQTDFIFLQYHFCWSHSTLSNKQWQLRFTVGLWDFFGVQISGISGYVYK